MARKEACVAAFIDFEGAFNAVWHDALRWKICKCEAIPSTLGRWLSLFLCDRSFAVIVGNAISSEAVIAAGVPQGSALSPILFSLFTADLPEKTRAIGDAETLMYADNITRQSARPAGLVWRSHESKGKSGGTRNGRRCGDFRSTRLSAKCWCLGGQERRRKYTSMER